jgi:hypothetical protein
MTDTVEFKRGQIKALKAAKEARHGSVLDGFVVASEPDDANRNELDRKPLRPCPACDKGMVQGLFAKFECSVCHGTGYELDDPIEVIKALIAGGKKLRKLYRNQAMELREFKGMWTAQEIEQRAETLLAAKHHSRFD